jgi:hypothetical protein
MKYSLSTEAAALWGALPKSTRRRITDALASLSLSKTSRLLQKIEDDRYALRVGKELWIIFTPMEHEIRVITFLNHRMMETLAVK